MCFPRFYKRKNHKFGEKKANKKNLSHSRAPHKHSSEAFCPKI
jgi:hypothetical protein